MMLGDVLKEARHAAAVLDPELRAEIEAAGHLPGPFAREALASFERHASEEDWATIMSAIRNAADPGRTCIETMVRWRLAHARRHAQHATPRREQT